MRMKLTTALCVGLLGGTAFALSSQAQSGFLAGRSGAMRGRAHSSFRGARQGGFLRGPRLHRSFRRFRTPVTAYPYFYAPYFYSDYYSEPAPSEQEQAPRVVVVETSQPKPAAPPAPPPESLVLELQGNHWVRITNSGRREVTPEQEQQAPARTSAVRTITRQESAAIQPAREVPAAVLVFRDGHKEEISRYMIIGGTIYAGSDYWNNGSWTKKVPIAELNVPETLKLNRERGTNFSFPSSPGVIAIRP